MKQISLIAVAALAVTATFASPAAAQVTIRVPFVRVQVGDGVHVRAPFVNLYVPSGPRYYVLPGTEQPSATMPPASETLLVPAKKTRAQDVPAASEAVPVPAKKTRAQESPPEPAKKSRVQEPPPEPGKKNPEQGPPPMKVDPKNDDDAPPAQLGLPQVLTPDQFVNNFQPKAGNYEVTILNPITKQATTVRFSLPEGGPRRVRASGNQIEFDYGPRQYVRIRFDRDGAEITSR